MKKIAVALSLVLSAGAACAQLLVEETWNYEEGSSPSTWTGGVGFVSTPWNPAAKEDSGATIVSGLSLGSMRVSGAAVHVAITAGDSSSVTSSGDLRRQMKTAEVSSGELWVAYLFAFDTVRSTIPDDENLQIRSSGTLRTGIYENGKKVYLQKGSTSTASGVYAGIKGGETLLYVAKYAGMGSSDNASSKAWVLTASGYDSMLQNGGITEKNMDQYAVVTTVNGDQSVQTQAANAYVEIVPAGRNRSTPSFTVDELRYGKTLQDVVASQGSL